MPTQHIKSPCCNAQVRCYGERRRQCTNCLQTWRLSRHKRGRNPIRKNYHLVKCLVLGQQKLSDQKRYYPQLNLSGVTRRFEKALKSFILKPRSYPPWQGRYILLGDGIQYTFDREDWTLYVFLLKPRRRNYAYLLEPVMIKGKESYSRWQRAIDAIPWLVRKRIIGLVSDNFHASGKIIKHYGWLHQLCHFHLIKELYRRLGRRKNLDDRFIREAIYQTICELLVVQEEQVRPLLRRLESLVKLSRCSRKLKMMSHEFTRLIDQYRTYLEYPNFTIPKTNNATESLVNLIRGRTRKLNNPQATERWAKAFMRLKFKMNCNGQNGKNINQIK